MATIKSFESGEALRASVPELADRLRIDGDTRDAMADDFGHLVRHRPMAVLAPRSAADIQTLVRSAGAAGICVAARGQGHGTMGQAQARDGVVIDMRSLARVDVCDATSVWADAGVTWRALARHTLQHGLAPRVVTDYTGLSVGGTLSVGGLGMQSFRCGTLADNVLALEVVTGTGELVSCSAAHHSELFDACRAGLGQFGIITRARIPLVQAPARVRVYRVLYHRLDALLADLGHLVTAGRFDGMQAYAVPGTRDAIAQRFGAAARHMPGTMGAWVFMAELASYMEPAPEDHTLLGDLHAVAGCHMTRDMAYSDFLNRLDALVARFEAGGQWAAPHPWIHVLVPWESAAALIEPTLDELAYEDMGLGPVMISALDRAPIQAPLFRTPGTPADSRFAMLGLLCNATDVPVTRLQTLGEQLHRRALALGGMRYAIDTPLTPEDAARHFGPAWAWMTAAKQRYDPACILAPNQQLFTRPR